MNVFGVRVHHEKRNVLFFSCINSWYSWNPFFMPQSQWMTHNFKSTCNSQVYLIYFWIFYAFYLNVSEAVGYRYALLQCPYKMHNNGMP